MDDDNQEFFDLLNQTTQSFYQALGESSIDPANHTFYAGMNNSANQDNLQVYDNSYEDGLGVNQ